MSMQMSKMGERKSPGLENSFKGKKPGGPGKMRNNVGGNKSPVATDMSGTLPKQ